MTEGSLPMYRAAVLILVLFANTLACLACLAVADQCTPAQVREAAQCERRTPPADGGCCMLACEAEPLPAPSQDCPRPCDPPPPETAPRDSGPRCCLIVTQVVFALPRQGRTPEQRRIDTESTGPSTLPPHQADGAGGAQAWRSPTRSGLPAASSRTRRAMLCVRTV